MENKKAMQFGKIQLNIISSGPKKSLRSMKGCQLDNQHQLLADALWQASTATAKLNTINTLPIYTWQKK